MLQPVLHWKGFDGKCIPERIAPVLMVTLQRTADALREAGFSREHPGSQSIAQFCVVFKNSIWEVFTQHVLWLIVTPDCAATLSGCADSHRVWTGSYTSLFSELTNSNILNIEYLLVLGTNKARSDRRGFLINESHRTHLISFTVGHQAL